MDYNSKSINPYIKSHLELQREITLIKLAPSLTFLFKVFVFVYINMFAKFDKIPAMTLQDIKETKRYRLTDARTHTRTDNMKSV